MFFLCGLSIYWYTLPSLLPSLPLSYLSLFHACSLFIFLNDFFRCSCRLTLALSLSAFAGIATIPARPTSSLLLLSSPFPSLLLFLSLFIFFPRYSSFLDFTARVPLPLPTPPAAGAVPLPLFPPPPTTPLSFLDEEEEEGEEEEANKEGQNRSTKNKTKKYRYVAYIPAHQGIRSRTTPQEESRA